MPPFSTIPAPAVGDPMTEIWKIINNDKALFISVSSLLSSSDLIPNGSFENDIDSDGEPDNWIVSQFNGGSFGTKTDESAHGGRCFYAIAPGGAGKGGASIENAGYIPVTASSVYSLIWKALSVPGNVSFLAKVSFYNRDKSIITSQILFESSDNPTSWGTRGAQFETPAGARYVRFFFSLGVEGSLAGTFHLDDVRFVRGSAPSNTARYETPGRFLFTVPDKVFGLKVIAGAGGGAGGAGNNLPSADWTPSLTSTGSPHFITYYKLIDLHFGGGGGGGGAFVVGIIPVIPGETIELIVGRGGVGRVGTWGEDGQDTVIGGFVVPGGKGGHHNAANYSYEDGPGGGGGVFENASPSSLLGVNGVGGGFGSKLNAKPYQTMYSTYMYVPYGGSGGAGHSTSRHPSAGGGGGNVNYTGINGTVALVNYMLSSRIGSPSAGTGYGAGGGGGSLYHPGGNGSGGFMVLEW